MDVFVINIKITFYTPIQGMKIHLFETNIITGNEANSKHRFMLENDFWFDPKIIVVLRYDV